MRGRANVRDFDFCSFAVEVLQRLTEKLPNDAPKLVGYRLHTCEDSLQGLQRLFCAYSILAVNLKVVERYKEDSDGPDFSKHLGKTVSLLLQKSPRCPALVLL